MSDEPRVTRDKVVQLAYVLRDADGTERERSDEGDPLEYLHGHGAIVPGLEEALEGAAVGAELSVVVPPEKGYGAKQQLKLKEMRRSQFPAGARLERGASFVMRTQDGGQLPVWVAKVQGPTVWIDLNHPLAGVPLHFEVRVLGVRDASDEEKAHGHAHGPDGHHH